ncbi:Cilia and flagella-associated protein 70 [Taenia crassiceps]|uniref:Cilia and flagella-associated protein 70 n=1 Tax=Taenia crassiceps TaxID=6207 RepID=A0ABR4Q2S2_9CEST
MRVALQHCQGRCFAGRLNSMAESTESIKLLIRGLNNLRKKEKAAVVLCGKSRVVKVDKLTSSGDRASGSYVWERKRPFVGIRPKPQTLRTRRAGTRNGVKYLAKCLVVLCTMNRCLHESHGVAFADLSQLLWPGVTSVRGTYAVKRFADELFAQKDTEGASIAPEVADIIRRAANASARKKDKSASILPKETAKSTTAGNVPLEGINFDQHNVYVSVDIELSKPLLPQRKEESAVLEVRDVLKAMGPASTEPMNALKCARALGSGIIRLLSDVFSHVRPPFERLGVGNEASGSFNFAPNERALEDIYLDFQSHLHFPIAADVRKCFAEITESLLQDCIQNFLGDLKVRLMQEGRELLRCVVEGEYEARGMPSIGGLTQSDLRYFAEEAEVLGNLSWANFFVQNMLAEEPKSKETLIAASSFYARVGNREEAIVCLRWWLEMSPDDAEVLWRLGILLAEVGKLDEAKRLLEAASQIAPSDATLWTVLGDTRDFERTLAVMDQLKHPSNITSEASKSDGQEEEEEEEEESVVPQYTDCMDLIGTIDRLLEVKASTFVDRALARLLLHMKEYRCTLGGAEAEDEFKLPDWIVRSSRSCRDYMHDLSAYHRLLARHIMQSSEEAERLQQAEAHLKAASQRQPECADNWACLGSLRCLQGDKEGAIDCFERAMQLETWPVEKSHLLQVQLARCYAEVKDFERSKSQYLRCCNKHPTAESWKGVGVACLRLNELEEAEVAFKEANRLNNRDAAVWAYLAMLCLKAKKRTQAEICLQAVEMLGLADESIRKELDEVLTNTENLSNDGN